MQYQFILNEIIGLAWWILRPKKMPKIEQASGPKYVLASGLIYIAANVNINDIKHNYMCKNAISIDFK